MSILDPTIEVRKFLIALVVLLLTAVFGAIGGCEYKQRQWDKDKLAASEAARKLEKEDSKLGHRKVEELGQDKITISEAEKWVKDAVKSAPKKLVDCGKIEIIEPSKNEVVKNETIKTETIVPLLTVTFMQLYDVSVDPTNVGLRGRSYETAEQIRIDEGFEIIKRNDFKFSEDRAQLKRLQENICEKQKLYSQPLNKWCSSF